MFLIITVFNSGTEDESVIVVEVDENVFDGMFAFMAKSNDEEDEEVVNLLDLKQNLSVCSVRSLRNLVVRLTLLYS